MHFAVSWDIKVSGEEASRLNVQLKEKISPYPWVQALSNFYIVRVDSQETWDKILKELQAIGLANPYKVNFVITPLMVGGRYNGILPQNLWGEINQKSE